MTSTSRLASYFYFHFDCGLKILFRPRIWLKESVSRKDSWILKFRKRFLKKLNRSLKRLHICGFLCFSTLELFLIRFFLPSTPHYHVVSRRVNVGYISPFINYLRAFLIEGLFRRLGRFFFKFIVLCWNSLFTATMFPETANWLTPADEYVLYYYNFKLQKLTVCCI